jgi:hypothetical protein
LPGLSPDFDNRRRKQPHTKLVFCDPGGCSQWKIPNPRIYCRGALGTLSTLETYFPENKHTNIGSANLANIYGILRSSDSFFTIQDSVGYFGTVNVDSNVENDADTFSFQVAGQVSTAW